jgi:ribosomal protein L30E
MAGVLNGNILATGALASSAGTADQVILTYTVPAGKTFYLSYFEANVKLTTFATTATDFGPVSLRQNGVKKLTFMNAGPGVLNAPVYVELPDALPFQAGDVLTVVCTPTAVTPFTWEANIAGFEK